MNKNSILVFWFTLFGTSVHIITYFVMKGSWSVIDCSAAAAASWVVYVAARETRKIMVG